MFSQHARCHYHKSPLAEVVCQLRFPEILTIEANAPVQFQEAIRSEFPRYSVRKESSAPKLIGVPGNLNLQNSTQFNNYQFSTADGSYRINLSSKSISLTCSRYVGWETFAKMLDKPLAAFIKIYRPAFFDRAGLRYLNFISRKELELEGTPFRELIHPHYLGLLADPQVQEASTRKCTVDVELSIRGGCQARIHAGPGLVTRNSQPDKEIKFIFDMDLFMSGNIPVNMSAGALQTLHAQSFPIFRGAVTDVLHDAMEPEDF